MDIYFRFDKKNRCLLTATMMEFSNPCLKYEARFNLTDSKKIPRNINLIHTDNINALVKREIEKHTNEEKLLIAYNSITQILGIINNLDPELLSILVQSVQPI
jgi:histidinol dehydrogenase